MADRFDKDTLLAAPAGWSYPLEVRFQDVDAAGVVFFVRVFEYFHDAYVAFLAAHGCRLPEVLAEGAWAAPLVHAEADFVRPLVFGDRLEVELVAARLEESQATIGYRVRRGADVVALGQTAHVFIDRPTRRRRAIPEVPRTALARLAGA